MNNNNDPLNFSKEVQKWEDLHRIFESIKKTPLVKKMGEEAIWTILVMSRCLNIDTFKALKNLNFVRGKIEMSVHLMSSMIRAAGHSIIKSDKSTPDCCILIGTRKDNNDKWTAKFSLEDARKAGLYASSPTWKAYPERMLYARALSILGRELFSDVIGGVYVEGEISEAIQPSKIEVIPPSPLSNEKAQEINIHSLSYDEEIINV